MKTKDFQKIVIMIELGVKAKLKAIQPEPSRVNLAKGKPCEL